MACHLFNDIIPKEFSDTGHSNFILVTETVEPLTVLLKTEWEQAKKDGQKLKT